MSIKSRIFVLMFIIYGLHGLIYCSEKHEKADSSKAVQVNSTEEAIPCDSMLEASLEQAGWDIAELIINKDVPNLLKYFSEDIFLNWGGDPIKPSKEVMEELFDTTSLIYCHIFDRTCITSDRKRSTRDYFIEGDSLNLTVNITVNVKVNVDAMSYHDDYPRGIINYEWDGKPVYLRWSEFPDPGFIYYKGGWKFTSFFTE